MVNKKECPYCNKIIKFKHRNGFAAHCGGCNKRPGRQNEINKIRQKIISKRKDYFFNCKKCNKEFILNLPPHQYKIGNHRLFCSRKCANSKVFTEEQKKKKSLASLKYYSTHTHIRKGKFFGPLDYKTKEKLSKKLSKNNRYNIWFKKQKIKLCELCNSKNNLSIHHKDGNNQNNEVNNLIMLCKNCHTKEHYKIGTKTGTMGHKKVKLITTFK